MLCVLKSPFAVGKGSRRIGAARVSKRDTWVKCNFFFTFSFRKYIYESCQFVKLSLQLIVLSSFFSFGCFLRLVAGLFWLRFGLVSDRFVADCIRFSAFSSFDWSENIWLRCFRLDMVSVLEFFNFAFDGSVVRGVLSVLLSVNLVVGRSEPFVCSN